MRVDVFFTERFSGRARVCVCVCVSGFFVKCTTLQAFLCTSVFGWVLCKRNSFPPSRFSTEKKLRGNGKDGSSARASLCVCCGRVRMHRCFLQEGLTLNHQQPFIVSPGLQMLPPVYCDCYCFRVCVLLFLYVCPKFSVSVSRVPGSRAVEYRRAL